MFDEFAEFDRWDSTRISAFMPRSSQATYYFALLSFKSVMISACWAICRSIKVLRSRDSSSRRAN